MAEALRITLIGFAPGLFWLWYVRRTNRIAPEPRVRSIRIFALGCASAFAALWLRPIIDPIAPANPGWGRDLVDAFVVTALPEELLKLSAFLVGVWWCRDLDEPLDGIVYGAAAALGFASAENVIYLSETRDPFLIALRAFTATLAHVGFTGSLCFAVAMAHFSRKNAWLLGLGALFAAVTFHGAYNIFLWQGPAYTPLALLVVLPVTLAILGAKVRWSQRHAARHLSVTRTQGILELENTVG